MDKFVEELEAITDRIMKELGIPKASSVETSQAAPVIGTITFLSDGDLEIVKDRAKEWADNEHLRIKKNKR